MLFFGFLIKGMYYWELIEISFKVKGLMLRYVFESDLMFQIIQVVQVGICCVIMLFNNGFEVLSDNFEILLIVEIYVDLQLVLIMCQQELVLILVEKCFVEVQGIFG